jgi:signal transduction histidine kinase/ActR/RegA family two-component response regulator
MMDSSIRLEDGQLGVICHEHIGPPRHWSGEDQAFAASLGDLVAMTIMRSRQAEAEQQRRQTQKLEALGVLAGGIAHDFNNILAAINGFAELALREIPKESTTRSRLEQILRAGGRAADLVRQILAFSSRGERPKEIVNVSKVTGEVMTLLRASIPASIEITSNVKKEGHVLASVIEVQQILINLCTNSYHAMKENGRIEIGIDVVEFQNAGVKRDLNLAAGRYVCLSVSDTGPGIDPEMRERIFDPFFTTKPVGHGTGLGLAVVHGIVRYHRGAVDVTSTPGEGACFSVYLPLCEGQELDRPEPEVSVQTGDEHILFVDDEETLVSLWKEILEHSGYTVTCARNGEEALDLFQANPYTFDLVISDVTMPKMSGPDLAKAVFELRPGMPIIMTTGYTDTMITGRLRGLGIHGTLAKPCQSRLLLTAVRDVLDNGKQDLELSAGTR